MQSHISPSVLKDTMQDCSVSLLIGSGTSSPYLRMLGNIETLLTQLAIRDGVDADIQSIAKASIYLSYFEGVVQKNVAILNGDADAQPILNNYAKLLAALNSIMLRRSNSLLSKEVNLFTTNIDIFLELAIEGAQLECNDGFTGRFKPTFALSNFKKSHFKKSLHYDNVAEIPTFNLCKLHGSLSWILESDQIEFTSSLAHVKALEAAKPPAASLVNITPTTTIDTLLVDAATKTPAPAAVGAFVQAYEKLLIVVNPTKDKFRHTVLNQTYYEMLRQYSNELERENAILFVFGFSFADEHIREITIRAANSNPTLLVYVLTHSTKSREQIASMLDKHTQKNANVKIVGPDQQEDAGVMVDSFQYDLENINKRIFGEIVQLIENASVD